MGGGCRHFLSTYLKALLEKAEAVGDTDGDDAQVLKAALGVRMERQGGSHYFITARNATSKGTFWQTSKADMVLPCSSLMVCSLIPLKMT